MNFYLLGQKIRKLRNNMHLSQADLAEMVDVSTNYIGQIERGDRKPSIETLVLLCNAMNTTMDYILSDSLTPEDDPLTCDILSRLAELSPDEKLFFYNTICNYIQMKEKSSGESGPAAYKSTYNSV